SASTWFARPGRLLATHRSSTSQWAMEAAAAALRSRTARTCSAISTSGVRHEYCNLATRCGRLSAVACPSVRMASEKLHPPVAGSIESSIVRLDVYICDSATLAPGARAAECEAGIGEFGSALESCQVSGWSQTKLYTFE